MLKSKQIISYDDPSQTFLGVRFVLQGFDCIEEEEKVRSKLIERGGIDAVNYGPNCNYVIVDKLVYDDPVCINARKDGKKLVNSLWVYHSFDMGIPVDPSPVMYRPLKDLNGIPGAKSLVVCLTGYQRQDRDDIMTMVSLMGANFSKPLIANKVTHLICYKFEGEKYELAKKMMKIKLVNHHWLEDCLKAWELLPEAEYDRSGYELELMAAAKDSEEETEDMDTSIDLKKHSVITPQNTNENKSFYHSPPKSLRSSTSKFFPNDLDPSKVHSTPGRDFFDKHLKMPSPLSAKSPGKTSPQVPLNMLDCTNISKKFDNVVAERSKKSPVADMAKSSSKSKNKSNPRKHTSPLRPECNFASPSAANVNKFEASGGFDIEYSSPQGNEGKHAKSIGDEGQTGKSPNQSKSNVSRGVSKLPILNLDIECGGKTPSKVPDDEGQTVKLASKSKTTISRGSLKSPMSRHDPKSQTESDLATKSVDHLNGFAEKAPNDSLTRLRKQISPNSDAKVFSSIRTNNSSGGVQTRRSDAQTIEQPLFDRTDTGIEKMDLQDDPENTSTHVKPVKSKLLAKKTLGSKRTISKASSTKLKGTLNLKNDILQNEYEIRPDGEVAMEDLTDNATTVDDDVSSEKEASRNVVEMKVNSIDEGKKPELAKSRKSSKKTGLAEPKSKSDAGEKKLTKGKKRLLSDAKTDKSKDSGAEGKNDEKKTVPCNEESVVLAGKTKVRPSKKLKKNSDDLEKENDPPVRKQQSTDKEVLKSGFKADKTDLDFEEGTTNNLEVKGEPAWFILSGHRLQRKDFQQLIRRLKGRVCRDSHIWSYQATHFIVPDPVKRTEKFFAAAASGRWILKSDYLTASNEAGRLLFEEPYEWHKKCLTEDGAINLEAPRKWRLLKEKTGHGAFYGMRVVIYGECIAPPLDTLKRAIKAGDGTILATAPPYSRFLQSGIDFAIVSPGMPRVDIWVQEFLRHEVPCVVADYLVEYVCKPGYSLDRHVQYNTHAWAQKSLENLKKHDEDVRTPQDSGIADLACKGCGCRDRGDEMIICGDESGKFGCGVGFHLGCLDPPLDGVPEEDWFCMECRVDKERKCVSQLSKKKGF